LWEQEGSEGAAPLRDRTLNDLYLLDVKVDKYRDRFMTGLIRSYFSKQKTFCKSL
jgi:hypothetical protein